MLDTQREAAAQVPLEDRFAHCVAHHGRDFVDLRISGVWSLEFALQIVSINTFAGILVVSSIVCSCAGMRCNHGRCDQRLTLPLHPDLTGCTSQVYKIYAAHQRVPARSLQNSSRENVRPLVKVPEAPTALSTYKTSSLCRGRCACKGVVTPADITMVGYSDHGHTILIYCFQVYVVDGLGTMVTFTMKIVMATRNCEYADASKI